MNGSNTYTVILAFCHPSCVLSVNSTRIPSTEQAILGWTPRCLIMAQEPKRWTLGAGRAKFLALALAFLQNVRVTSLGRSTVYLISPSWNQKHHGFWRNFPTINTCFRHGKLPPDQFKMKKNLTLNLTVELRGLIPSRLWTKLTKEQVIIRD